MNSMESDKLLFTFLHPCSIYLSFLFGGSYAGTVSTSGSLTATIGGSVDFTCTYTLDSGDTVYPGSISWQIITGPGPEEFTNIATFSPPGSGGSNSFTNFATDYKNRSELFNVTVNGANSYVVVMRVNEVVCSDENHYRCSVLFINTGLGPVSKTKETSLSARAPSEQPYDIPVPVPDNIEENTEVTLSCTANVGKPPGQIRWWRYRNGIMAPQEITGVSTTTPPVQRGVCVYNVTSTVTYRMTKDDDQSVWRCFVDNELLTMLDRDKPYQESKRINVYFKVNVPIIRKVPDSDTDSQYSVGSSVTLLCEAEGNPTPGINANTTVNRYLWTFTASPNSTASELSSNNGTLSLSNLNETDTGTYTCTAFNGFNGKFFNASNEISLQIVKTITTTSNIMQTTSSASSERTSKRFTITPQGGLGCLMCKMPTSAVKINYGQQQIRINHEQQTFRQCPGQRSEQPHQYRQCSPPGYCRQWSAKILPCGCTILSIENICLRKQDRFQYSKIKYLRNFEFCFPMWE